MGVSFCAMFDIVSVGQRDSQDIRGHDDGPDDGRLKGGPPQPEVTRHLEQSKRPDNPLRGKNFAAYESKCRCLSARLDDINHDTLST